MKAISKAASLALANVRSVLESGFEAIQKPEEKELMDLIKAAQS